MKKILILLAVAIFSAGLVFAQNDDLEVWDFGKINITEVVKHEFSFKNDTGKIMEVKDVTVSCGCVTAEIKEKMLLPGETTVINVKFNSEGYTGNVEHFVYVNTDDAGKPVYRYRLKGEVIDPGTK